jgi:prepilin-type N-terminal cleavage/methylation domain-containing protein
MPASRRTHESGFSLIEMVIALMVLVIVLVGALTLFDLASRVSRVQVDVADMQQSLRTAQYDMVRILRMAGRGHVPTQVAQPLPPAAAPFWSVPNGIAVAVRNNVAANKFMDDPANTKRILAGTDVLTVRGVFTSPVCTVMDGTFTVDKTLGSPTYGQGSFQVANIMKPNVPVPQNLKHLADSIAAGIKEGLVLVSSEDDSIYQIVELDPPRSVVDNPANPALITVGFRFDGGTNTATFLAFSSGTWNGKLKEAAYFGIMEEYRFYVLDERETPGDATTAAKPRLVRAQTFPGTDQPYGNPGDPANWAVAMADNVADLQIALGVQSGGASPFTVDENGTAGDEWLFNNAGDNSADNKWRGGRLYYVRVSTTTFAERRDKDYESPANVTLEDHTYAVPDFGSGGGVATPDRAYRRRTLRTLVDLRNIT